MPSSDPVQRFQDILDNIALIRRYLETTTKAEFFDGGMAYDATAYAFLRLAEAATKLGDLPAELAPNIPWPAIRGMGNHLRHAYDGIDPDILWDTAEQSFAALERACREAITRLDPELD